VHDDAGQGDAGVVDEVRHPVGAHGPPLMLLAIPVRDHPVAAVVSRCLPFQAALGGGGREAGAEGLWSGEGHGVGALCLVRGMGYGGRCSVC
jgi:hypothetical protein